MGPDVAVSLRIERYEPDNIVSTTHQTTKPSFEEFKNPCGAIVTKAHGLGLLVAKLFAYTDRQVVFPTDYDEPILPVLVEARVDSCGLADERVAGSAVPEQPDGCSIRAWYGLANRPRRAPTLGREARQKEIRRERGYFGRQLTEVTPDRALHDVNLSFKARRILQLPPDRFLEFGEAG
jgi:hypothetical protein